MRVEPPQGALPRRGEIPLQQDRPRPPQGRHRRDAAFEPLLPRRVLRDESLIEAAREDASTLLDTGMQSYPLLAAELAQVQADATAEFIDKA